MNSSRREFIGAAGAAVLGSSVGIAVGASAARTELAHVAERGRRFLESLFDPQLDLLPEFPGADTYWLFHDNYLAAKLLDGTKPQMSAKIRAAIRRFGVTRSGKIEILFNENPHALPLRHFALKDIASIGKKRIKTEIVTDRVNDDYRLYADLLFFTALAETDPRRARANFDDGMKMWDGRGFSDQAARDARDSKPSHYATYKLGLALLAAKKLAIHVPQHSAILDRLLAQQNDAGGWTTDYTSDLRPSGLANVETTCIAILAIS